MDFTLTDSLLCHIDKLVGNLKDEDELKEVLKRKFTKKEFKVFVAMEKKVPMEEITALIKDDEDRVKTLYKNACKKINQEQFKQELVEH